jgi:hypothetical protein
MSQVNNNHPLLGTAILFPTAAHWHSWALAPALPISELSAVISGKKELTE